MSTPLSGAGYSEQGPHQQPDLDHGHSGAGLAGEDLPRQNFEGPAVALEFSCPGAKNSKFQIPCLTYSRRDPPDSFNLSLPLVLLEQPIPNDFTVQLTTS